MFKQYLYRIKYAWYENEEDEFYVATDLKEEEFNEYLSGIIPIIESKTAGDHKMCPYFFDELYKLMKADSKTVVIPFHYNNTEYYVSDYSDKELKTHMRIERRIKEIKWERIGEEK